LILFEGARVSTAVYILGLSPISRSATKLRKIFRL